MVLRRLLKLVKLLALATLVTAIGTLVLLSASFSMAETSDYPHIYVPNLDENLNNKNPIASSGSDNNIRTESAGETNVYSDDVLERRGKFIRPNHNRQRPQPAPVQVDFDLHRRHRSSFSAGGEPDCRGLAVRFALPGSLPRCALMSYPGSGNTWLRRLLEDATGVFTGSVYTDGKLYSKGYYGELEPWTAGTTIVQKTHTATANGSQYDGTSSRGILLLRNPYKAILSYHNFLFAGHQMYASMTNYRRKDWPAFVHRQLWAWLKTLSTAVSGPFKDLLVVHYENLRQNPSQELKRILSFLRVPVNNTRLECLQRTRFLGTSLQRPKQHFTESLPIFPNQTRDKVDRAIAYSSYLLSARGHQRPPTSRYHFYNGTIVEGQMSLVRCGRGEPALECDQRVDDLNSGKRYTADLA